MTKDEIIKELDKQNIQLGIDLSLTEDKLVKTEWLLERTEKENKKLNNIINELENMTIKELEEYNNLNGMVRGCINGYHYCKLLHRYLDKLQELKENK